MKTKKDQENSVKEVCEFCHTVFIWMQVVVSKMVELDKIKIYPKKEVLNTIHFSFSMKVTVRAGSGLFFLTRFGFRAFNSGPVRVNFHLVYLGPNI